MRKKETILLNKLKFKILLLNSAFFDIDVFAYITV